MAPKTRENWLIAGPLYVLTAIFAILGALAGYWVVHEWMGYDGGKSVMFYLGGGFAGAYLAWPLWWLYRKNYPKAGQAQE